MLRTCNAIKHKCRGIKVLPEHVPKLLGFTVTPAPLLLYNYY